MKENKTAFIALGSNIGDRENFLNSALDKMEEGSKIRVVKKSSIYETDPVGCESKDKFLNMVVKVETDLLPTDLLLFLQGIEESLGRVRMEKNGPRTIDLDILLFEDCVFNADACEKKLIIPHPRMHDRAFVLVPFAEIAPKAAHPKFKKIIKELLRDILNKTNVEKVELWKMKK